jgi:hypothetical protein
MMAFGNTKCILVDGDIPKKKSVVAVAVVISHDLWDLCPLLQ